MDRTGQLWVSKKQSEIENLYVIVCSHEWPDCFEHDIVVFSKGRLIRQDMRVKETKPWETYIKLVRVA